MSFIKTHANPKWCKGINNLNPDPPWNHSHHRGSQPPQALELPKAEPSSKLGGNVSIGLVPQKSIPQP